MKLVISIGILAYNESSSIGSTLLSLMRQSLFYTANSDTIIEIIIVPNGCTDDTASIAESTLEALISPFEFPQVRWQVCPLVQAGKSNAWNVYVHHLADPNAQYLCLMDADIELLETDTLVSMLGVLEQMPEAWVAVDKPIKDVALKQHRNLREKISVAISSLSGSGKTVEEGPAWICGQLYIARSEILKKIWLPNNLPTNDSFLYDMVVTDGLVAEANPNRVIRAKSSSHSFEAYVHFDRLLRHEKWLIKGKVINELVYKDLIDEGISEKGAGELIKNRNERDPNWLNKSVKALAGKTTWLIPRIILLRRFTSLFHHSLFKSIFLLPLAVAAFILDLILAFQANFELHQGSPLGYWGKSND